MKIDTSTIQGFNEMTLEQKLEAVLGMDIQSPDMTGWVKKDVFDAKASEAADLSKKLRAKMTEEEAAKAAELAEKEELKRKIEELTRKDSISTYRSRYLAMGYDDKLALETAEAIADGDMEKVLANGEKFKADIEKKMRSDILKGTPRPDSDNSGKTMTVEEISKIKDASERQAAIANNLSLYGYKER